MSTEQPKAFGIPAGERRHKKLVGILVKSGRLVPNKSGSGTHPEATPFFTIGRPSLTGLQKIKQFDGENDEPEEITIELISDNINDMWRDALCWYDGKRRGCYNDTGSNQALRRAADGTYKPVECDPSRCPMRLNGNHRPTKEQSEAKVLTPIQAQLVNVYKERFSHLTITKDSQCKAESYFVFALPDPENPEQLLTRRGEYARYVSHSDNINAQLLEGLADVAKRTQGYMAGLRVKLVITYVSNGFGGMVPTVGLVGPTDADLPQAVRDMARRRAMNQVNMTDLIEKVGRMTEEEFAEVDQDYIFEHFTKAADPSLPAGPAMLALPGKVERRQVRFATKHPLAQALFKRLNLSYAVETDMQLKFGEDVQACVDKLVTTAQTNNIDVSDLISRYPVEDGYGQDEDQEVTEDRSRAAESEAAPGPTGEDDAGTEDDPAPVSYEVPSTAEMAARVSGREPEGSEFTEVNDEEEDEAQSPGAGEDQPAPVVEEPVAEQPAVVRAGKKTLKVQVRPAEPEQPHDDSGDGAGELGEIGGNDAEPASIPDSELQSEPAVPLRADTPAADAIPAGDISAGIKKRKPRKSLEENTPPVEATHIPGLDDALGELGGTQEGLNL